MTLCDRRVTLRHVAGEPLRPWRPKVGAVGDGDRTIRRTRRRLAVLGVLLVAALASVAFQVPPQERVPHFAERPVSVIAHSGAQAYAPTNTLPAFDLALAQGADTLEMDLQL